MGLTIHADLGARASIIGASKSQLTQMTESNRSRNKLCNCGSGKKFKNCCKESKVREQHVFAISKPVGTIFPDGIIPAATWKIRMTEKGLQLSIGDQELGTELYLVNSYSRAGKTDKVLRQVPLKTFDLQELLNLSAIHRSYLAFAFIFVIDTNTRNINGQPCSASYCLICNSRAFQNKVKFQYRTYAIFQYQNLSPSDAEKQGFLDLIRSIQGNPGYRPAHNIGLVTDHDLMTHVRINDGEVTLCDGSKLPRNFKVIYASADGGAENPLKSGHRSL